MNERSELGKIKKCELGAGGYDDAMIGFSFELGGSGWGVGDFWGAWSSDPSPGAKWTEESRNITLGKNVIRVNKLLESAKVKTISQLVGVPVEVKFIGNNLKSWRVLTEVI